MHIAVVIPFFQQQAGLLAHALGSVFAQRDVADVRVVVVDDASPISARSEVADLGETRFPVVIVEQPNSGPAAARNRALDAIGADVTHVAFLDSDDAWTPEHLAHATLALTDGADFYFSDHFQAGQDVSAFARAGRLKIDEHPALERNASLHLYTGDMFDQIISGNVIGTSTVVYDFAKYRALRFDEAYFSAGEDYLFWIACARAGARFAFSTQIEVRYGFGVNVYAGSGWGTDGYLRRIQNEMRYRKALSAFVLTPAQRAANEDKVRVLRYEFANDVVHRVMHRKTIPNDLLRIQWQLDPATLWMLPVHAGQIVARRIKGRSLE